MMRTHILRIVLAIAIVVAVGAGSSDAPGRSQAATATCESNVVVCENQKPGSPNSEWDVAGAGDLSIQGFASPFSVDHGQTVDFKVKTDAADYHIDVYRLGYYGGMGARKVATLSPTVPLPQTQPQCAGDSTTGLTDCGNWSVSAGWTVPADAVSGVYVAKLVRTDTGGASHIVFVVRDDERHAALLFQTSDATWEAYNRYGGNSLYFGAPAGRAYKVSYNRPFTTRVDDNPSWLFSGEYPMIRWLERNGYDVSYFTDVDTAQRGSELLNHKAFLSVGHDEYWSAEQRANVQAARDAGVNLGFFSGNESYWKTRWEASIDGTGTPFRTLVTYKETKANAKIDPTPTWTGTWRDARFSPPADGGRPENALTGTQFTVDAYRRDALTVPSTFAHLRFWRNTSVANLSPGQSATFPAGILGHEWDEDVDNGARPQGLFDLSSTTLTVDKHLVDEGNTFVNGSATHHLTLYRAPSGALVFGAGTVQWSWGLDDNHDVLAGGPPPPPDSRLQQATVNLFADMGVQPASIQSDLVAGTASTDAIRPISTITSPSDGLVVRSGTVVAITGTASDTGGGVVAGVEVTTDGGATWHPATGTTNWSYSWTASSGPIATIESRAVDDSGNLEIARPGVTVEVACPCRLWKRMTQPSVAASGDSKAIEVGVKFTPDTAGWATGLRFYKGPGNDGTHVGSLWTADGALLSRATFTGETTSGWQSVQFDAPVPLSPNVTYVASYYAPRGHYALDLLYFSSSGVDNSPLHAPADAGQSHNGIFTYGSAPAFPTSSYSASNYWVDVEFFDQQPIDKIKPTIVGTAPTPGASDADARSGIVATFSEAMTAQSVTASTFHLQTATGESVPATVTYDPVGRTATLKPASPLSYGAAYVATINGGAAGVADLAGNRLAADFSWSLTVAPLRACPCSIWASNALPAVPSSTDSRAVELGMKFKADLAGYVSGVRFYKGAGNTGTHVGSLWSNDGTLLARATFGNESATGWQEVTFDGAVPVVADQTYVVSYFAPNGRYALTPGAFSSSGVDNPPLRALDNGGATGNGVYNYSSTPVFPASTFGASNYWVDVVYSTTPPADVTPPKVDSTSPAAGSSSVASTADVTATFSEQIDPSTVNASTFTLSTNSGPLPASVTYNQASRTAVLHPNQPLALGTSYTALLATGIKDIAGNALASANTWTFATRSCPCSIWTAADRPAVESSSDRGGVELGVRFRSDTNGWITGVRFYKGASNTGIHVGSLWSSSGSLLATAMFSNETSAGWQDATFDGPVAITAGTTYVASYYAPHGGYALDEQGFSSTGVDRPPLTALRNGVDGANGLFRYGPSSAFPTDTYGAGNYWVDVDFATNRPTDTQPPRIILFVPSNGTSGVSATNPSITVQFSEQMDAATINGATVQVVDANGTAIPGTASYDATTHTASVQLSSTLDLGSSYSILVRGGPGGVTDAAGNPLAADQSATFSTRACPCSLWDANARPALDSAYDTSSVELGLRFQTDRPGTIVGLRFYKGAGNGGTHVGSLWGNDGTLLARQTFASETATGWQEVRFASPVAVTPNTTYVASYLAPQGAYSVSAFYFSTIGFSNPPLLAPANDVGGGNGVYSYTAFPAFPTQSYGATNYWVDVLFRSVLIS